MRTAASTVSGYSQPACGRARMRGRRSFATLGARFRAQRVVVRDFTQHLHHRIHRQQLPPPGLLRLLDAVACSIANDSSSASGVEFDARDVLAGHGEQRLVVGNIVGRQAAVGQARDLLLVTRRNSASVMASSCLTMPVPHDHPLRLRFDRIEEAETAHRLVEVLAEQLELQQVPVAVAPPDVLAQAAGVAEAQLAVQADRLLVELEDFGALLRSGNCSNR